MLLFLSCRRLPLTRLRSFFFLSLSILIDKGMYSNLDGLLLSEKLFRLVPLVTFEQALYIQSFVLLGKFEFSNKANRFVFIIAQNYYWTQTKRQKKKTHTHKTSENPLLKSKTKKKWHITISKMLNNRTCRIDLIILS